MVDLLGTLLGNSPAIHAMVLVFSNVLFNKIKDRAILVMKGGRLNWMIINKTSINVFFKIKKILFKDKPVKVNRLNIKLCFWNIGGLKSKTHNKLSDPIFLQHIFKHDIILLAETHVG
jgi:hypothetical protein